jgi:hypothetical protein
MTTEDLSAREQQLLEQYVADFEPPAGAADRVLARVASSAAAPIPTAPMPAAAALGTKAILAIAAVALAVGAAGGFLAGRQTAAPIVPLPPVIEAVAAPAVPPAVERPAEPPTAALPAPAPAVPKRKPEPSGVDLTLAREHHLLETARSAVLHVDPAAAIAALEAHARDFAQGRLEEEREALWIQALLQQGATAAARERMARFDERFPTSLLRRDLAAAFERK